MIILPAIDLRGGECVRLLRGDFATTHKVAESPSQTAADFRQAGAVWLHMVDLDGAKNGVAANARVVAEIAKTAGLKIELGGGIRDMNTIERYLSLGVSRVILGSAAVKNPTLTQEAAEKFGDRVAVGIDARDGFVATDGWVDTSEINYLELAKKMEQFGVKYLIFTDISRDGMLSGVNIEQLAAINNAVSCNIIASGGVRAIADIITCKGNNLYGVICGKSLYSGSLSLREAIETAGDQTC